MDLEQWKICSFLKLICFVSETVYLEKKKVLLLCK